MNEMTKNDKASHSSEEVWTELTGYDSISIKYIFIKGWIENHKPDTRNSSYTATTPEPQLQTRCPILEA